MNRNLKSVAVLLMAVAATLAVASCTDENVTPGNEVPTTHNRMYGTRWNKVYKDFTVAPEGYYDQNNHMYIHLCTATLEFTTDSTGRRRLSKEIYDQTDEVAVEHYSDTVAYFRYVYRGGDSQYGPGTIYWSNGDSNQFYVQTLATGSESLYMAGEHFPDNSTPTYTPVN